MPQFLDQFPRIADGTMGSGFAKGLLTAMIELGAFVGMGASMSTYLLFLSRDWRVILRLT